MLLKMAVAVLLIPAVYTTANRHPWKTRYYYFEYFCFVNLILSRYNIYNYGWIFFFKNFYFFA